jgi:hypothetical protein
MTYRRSCFSNGSVHEPEGGEGQALDHDLHAEIGDVPAAVAHDVVEQVAQVRVDRVVARELGVEVLGEDLDVPGLVDHLGGGVELGVDPGNGLDDASGADERTLLPVQELREHPVLALDVERQPLLGAPRRDRGAAPVDLVAEAGPRREVRRGHRLLVDVDLPGQVGLGVPLAGLGLLVEPGQAGAGALGVLGDELGVERCPHDVRLVAAIGLRHRSPG